MSFRIVRVVMPDESDGRLWPTMADPASTDVLLVSGEKLDGNSVLSVPVRSVVVREITGGGTDKLLHFRKIKGWLYVTDSRAVFACKNWDRGDTWIAFGGITSLIALAVTQISRARARARNRGKILTGQVRYAWLNNVRAAPQRWPLYPERVRLVCSTKDDKDGWRPYMLDVTLAGRGASALEVATEIIHRAAAFKLRWYDEMNEDSRAELTRLTTAPTLEQPARGKLSGSALPYYLAVTKSSAVPSKYDREARQHDDA